MKDRDTCALLQVCTTARYAMKREVAARRMDIDLTGGLLANVEVVA